jgi:hypothetical protein
MNTDLRSMDSAAMIALYERKLQDLSDDLLAGADWTDVQDKRRALIELSKLLHTHRMTTNPAEQPNRTE